MNKQQVIRYIPYSILFVSILSLNPYSIYPIGNTATTWIINMLILFSFYSVKPYLNLKTYKNELNIINFYLYYNIFCFFRGLFIAESYWDFKALFSNGLALLLPIVSFAGTNTSFVKGIIVFYLKFTLPLFLIFYFIILSKGASGFYLVPISFLALFLPLINKPWNWLVLSICIFVAVIELGARSNVIKFIIPLIFSSLYYFKIVHQKRILELIRKLIFAIPIAFLMLALFWNFNIFNINGYVEGNFEVNRSEKIGGKNVKEDLTVDTRTPLYLEVISTAQKYNSWIIGRSPARGNETELFSSLAEITGRKERAGNEVAILNIFTWTGIIGVIFYFIIFYRASYLAVNYSNNIFSKILGLYIGFRWCYAWVEDINYFTLTTFFLWITIGFCYSISFRKMTDKEVQFWVNSIFKGLSTSKTRV
ncbi:hypothetical protein PBAC_17080 [Pedobacter glucosidilyticus]|nr:hypothetical protein [Pedobacter glucosidilyticus]KHJ38167.1 hypothetical protein PBAC_17080 [Pedobacter glucosidilyticus]